MSSAQRRPWHLALVITHLKTLHGYILTSIKKTTPRSKWIFYWLCNLCLFLWAYKFALSFNIFQISGISWLIIYISIWNSDSLVCWLLFLWFLLLLYAAALSHLFYIHCDRKLRMEFIFLPFSWYFFLHGKRDGRYMEKYYMYANAFCLT